MSRYPDARAGWPKPPQQKDSGMSVEEARAKIEEVKGYFKAGHPVFKLSCERRDKIYAELGGGALDKTITMLEVMMEKGTDWLRRGDACVARESEPSTTGDTCVAPTGPVAGDSPPVPKFTAATLVRAAGEIRRLVDKREALKLEAMTRVAEEWDLAHMQMLTRQHFPEGELTPEEAMAHYYAQRLRPEATAPPKS